ncbi:hypothetical protein BGZ67_006747 [Mortierella alpina]|nr:hypothetical protein BGZ67_006747 [Mortierella alpina]
MGDDGVLVANHVSVIIPEAPTSHDPKSLERETDRQSEEIASANLDISADNAFTDESEINARTAVPGNAILYETPIGMTLLENLSTKERHCYGGFSGELVNWRLYRQLDTFRNCKALMIELEFRLSAQTFSEIDTGHLDLHFMELHSSQNADFDRGNYHN